MTKRQFDAAMKKLIKHGNAYRDQIDKLEKHSQDKFGLNWGDIGCDDIIDALEFGCGRLRPMTFDEFNKSITLRMEMCHMTMPNNKRKD